MRDESGKAKSPLSASSSSASRINSLVSQFALEDGERREKAREELKQVGNPAVEPLISALSDVNPQIRWEAAKTLGEIGSPEAIPKLIEAMEDTQFEVRWLAAEALINIGPPAVVPLLWALTNRSERVFFMQGAHHIINHVAGGDRDVEHHIFDHPWLKTFSLREALLPVLAAINGPNPNVDTPLAAKLALDKITGAEK